MNAESKVVHGKSLIEWIDKFSAWFLMLITPAPRQKPASFNLDQVMQAMTAANQGK